MNDDDNHRLAKADRDVLESAAAGKGLIPITSADQFAALAQRAAQVKHHFDATFETMTAEQADFVRALRCDEGYSWRAVAETCACEWEGDWRSNQLAGMALCEKAAEFFGEDYMQEPWN